MSNFKSISSDESTKTVSEKVETWLEEKNLKIESSDTDRPWGGFFVIAEDNAAEFIAAFFPQLDTNQLEKFAKLSPKILMVGPNKRLSWQYHHRRAEVWRVISGPVGVVVSDTDEQGAVRSLEEGEYIELNKGERHRLVGLGPWGIVAEIWKHTDPENPSDEEDIVRLEDDFGR